MSDSLSGRLLVSMPSMAGDYFSQSVTLLIEHNDQGAFGLVVNKPLDGMLSGLLVDQDLTLDSAPFDSIPLLETGPVEPNHLFFLHSTDVTFEDSFLINDDIAMTTSLDLIHGISGQDKPRDIIAGLGYAGWGEGQLDNEILSDVWLVTPYLHDAIFNSPYEDRPQLAARAIGVDLNLISPTPGHG